MNSSKTTVFVAFAITLGLSAAVGQTTEENVTSSSLPIWIELGGGGGLTTSSEFDGSDRFGGAFYGRLGGVLSSRMKLGIEFMAWGRGHEDLNPARGNLVLTTIIAPTTATPIYLRAGAGLAFAALIRDNVGEPTTRSATGLGFTGGIGYHVRLGRSVYLAPNLDILFQHFPTDPDPPISNFLILATVGLAFF